MTLVGLAFRKVGIPVEIEVAGDDDQAIAALQRPSAHFSCVLLDVKLPTKTGLEVLNGFAHSRALDDCRW